MSDDYQIDIPASFIDLYMLPSRRKPTEPRDVVAARYELCKDMATMQTDTASKMLCSLKITEKDVMDRCRLGVIGENAVLTEAEANWVLLRLAELLNWRGVLAPGHPQRGW